VDVPEQNLRVPLRTVVLQQDGNDAFKTNAVWARGNVRDQDRQIVLLVYFRQIVVRDDGHGAETTDPTPFVVEKIEQLFVVEKPDQPRFVFDRVPRVLKRPQDLVLVRGKIDPAVDERRVVQDNRRVEEPVLRVVQVRQQLPPFGELALDERRVHHRVACDKLGFAVVVDNDHFVRWVKHPDVVIAQFPIKVRLGVVHMPENDEP
jgi:hypothetical protein